MCQDYVDERNIGSKFGENPFWTNGWNKTILFSSEQRREQTSGLIVTLNGSKDAESRKDVQF